MPTALPIPVNPSVLIWARLESGYPVDRVAERLQVKEERIKAWESGERPPTLRQVENLSHFYHRPLSIFFQAAPPQVPALAAEYRRLPGITPGQESPELRLAIRRMSGRRETMLQLLEEMGEDVPKFSVSAHLNEEKTVVAARLRSALGIELAVQLGWSSEWQAWAAWRSAVERLGVLVFQFPKVSLDEARGLSLLRFPLPVAGVNSKETPEPKIFTLIHEVVHIMLADGRDEVPAARETRTGDAWMGVERFAEEVASHTLVPESALDDAVRQGNFPHNNWDVGDVRSLAKRFKISPLAMATRLRASGYISWASYRAWKESWDIYVASLKPRSGGFAHPIAQAISRAGRPYTQVVLEALAANRITPANASRYLDLKFEHFEKLKESLQLNLGAGGENE